MSISVIIPSAGRPTLEYVVASITHQLLPGDELIVVGARKPEIIRPMGDWRDDFVYIHRDNAGLRQLEPGYASGAVERDMGRAVAKGTHLIPIDDDDFMTPDYLQRAREAIANSTNPLDWFVFRMQYGSPKQWISPCSYRASFTPDAPWVLFGYPNVVLGNVGGAMYVIPNNEHLGNWDCSALGGAKNSSEDYWILVNYINKTGIQPTFIPHVTVLIRPTHQQIFELTSVMPPPTLKYTEQHLGPNLGIWDGVP
jgi:hypothetical protein